MKTRDYVVLVLVVSLVLMFYANHLDNNTIRIYEEAVINYKQAISQYEETIDTCQKTITIYEQMLQQPQNEPQPEPPLPEIKAQVEQAQVDEENQLVELRIYGKTSIRWLGKEILVHISFDRGQSRTIKCTVTKMGDFNVFWCSTWIPKGPYFVNVSTPVTTPM